MEHGPTIFFYEFCNRLQLILLSATEMTLMLFVAELAQTRAHSTIWTYLGVHNLNGHHNPLENNLRLELVLKLITLKEGHSLHGPHVD